MHFRRHCINVSILCSTLGLVSCAYAIEKSHQDVMFVTPGAEYAQCDVYVDKLRYQAFPPQKINIMKSDTDMEIRCIAPGNRMQTVTVPAKFAKRALWGGPPGVAWDYASESLYAYPSVIAIDFSQEVNKANPLPRHNSPDVVQPEAYDLEEYLPGTPRLNSDRNKKSEPLMRKDDMREEIAKVPETPIAEPKEVKVDKGTLEKVMKNLKTKDSSPVASSMIPLPMDEPALEDGMSLKSSTLPPPTTAGSKPVKLYPGE